MSNGCFLFLRCLLPTTENNGEAQKGCLCSQYTRLFVLSVWVWFKMISHKKWKSTMIHHICDGQEMVYGSHDFGPSLSLTYPGACMEGQSVCTYSQNGFICVCVELCCKVTPFDANRSYDGSRCNCRFGKEWVGLNVGIMGILTMGIPVKMNPIQLAWPWMTMTYNM